MQWSPIGPIEFASQTLKPAVWKRSHPDSIRTYRTQERRGRANRKQRRRDNRRRNR